MNKGAHLTYVNGLETSAINIADRGLAYGDGLFETLRVVDGNVPLMTYHLDRFIRGVEAIGLGDSKLLVEKFESDVTKALIALTKHTHLTAAVIKVIITRGQGGRGYTPPEASDANFITQVFEYPAFPESFYKEGVSLHLCAHRLSHQPVLAGIKHLNRLDQVLAASELLNVGAPEGVMLDFRGRVIEGTKSNILLIEGDQVITPNLVDCGVAGTLRQYLIDNSPKFGLDLSEQDVSQERLKNADGVAVCNSVFGLWPIKEFAGRRYAENKICGIIQSHLKDELSY
jgi:4-amino-4-deoxychorismate lyase